MAALVCGFKMQLCTLNREPHEEETPRCILFYAMLGIHLREYFLMLVVMLMPIIPS